MGRLIEGLAWPGGEHDFALAMGQLSALQDKCDAGPEFILNAIQTGSYRQEYLFETLRQGLIGGGMLATDARKLVYDMADSVPLRDLINPAIAVLAAALIGVPDDPVGKQAGEDPGQPFPTENGDGPASTDQGPP